MNGDHLGPSARRATLLVRAMDTILGTHRLASRTDGACEGARLPVSGSTGSGWCCPVADLSRQRIKHRPVLGGLINEYERAA
jgi:hypothetical protein